MQLEEVQTRTLRVAKLQNLYSWSEAAAGIRISSLLSDTYFTSLVHAYHCEYRLYFKEIACAGTKNASRKRNVLSRAALFSYDCSSVPLAYLKAKPNRCGYYSDCTVQTLKPTREFQILLLVFIIAFATGEFHWNAWYSYTLKQQLPSLLTSFIQNLISVLLSTAASLNLKPLTLLLAA